jgi:hypothetical protein
LGLNRLGQIQAIGGLALGQIALLFSYDHITIPLIVASVAIVFIDAELATGSRLRAAHDAVRAREAAARAANETARERHLAGEQRDRADRERNRAAQARKHQGESLGRLHQAALLSARLQLDPSELNRGRLQTFLCN